MFGLGDKMFPMKMMSFTKWLFGLLHGKFARNAAQISILNATVSEWHNQNRIV